MLWHLVHGRRRAQYPTVPQLQAAEEGGTSTAPWVTAAVGGGERRRELGGGDNQVGGGERRWDLGGVASVLFNAQLSLRP